MNRFTTQRALVGAACLAASFLSMGHPFVINTTSGTAVFSSTPTQNIGGWWTVNIRVTAGSPAVFTLTTDTNNTQVATLTVECDADCRMSIDEDGGGTFSWIGSVTEATSSSPESFEVGRIEIGGILSGVVAEVIEQIDIGGDLQGEIIAGPRADNTDSDITPSVIPAGREWWVMPVLTGDNALLSDDLLTTSVVPVADFDYLFDS